MGLQKRTSSNQTDSLPYFALVGTWVFSILLKLYPREFYSTFAEEMVDVFISNVNDVAADGTMPLLGCLLREAAEIPVALIAQHIYKRKKQAMRLLQYDTTQEIRLARWIARGSSLLIGGFIVILFILNEDVRNDPNLGTIILWIMTLGMLIAWRWERIGGTLVLASSPFLVLSMVFYWSGAEGLITPWWELMLIGITISLSFVIVGWLFISVAQHSEVIKTPAGTDPSGESPRSRSWTLLIVALLAVAAILFFLVPMAIPVQQQMEFSDDTAPFSEVTGVVDRFRKHGVVVGIGSATFERPPFTVPGSELNIEGAIVQVFKYGDVASATAEAMMINELAEDGWQQISWNEPPHIYQAGNVIVLYTGRDEDTLALLTSTLGTPFVGG